MKVSLIVLLVIVSLRFCHAFEGESAKVVNSSSVLCSPEALISDCFCETLKNDNLFNGIVQCRNRTRPTVFPLYCVTNTSDESEFIAGRCPFAGNNVDITKLQGNVSDLNKVMCGKLHRSGKLCSECEDGFLLSLNTADLRCINQSECKPSFWAAHFITEFAGITIFYLVILFLNVQLTSEAVSGSLFTAQIISLPINIIYFRRDWVTVLGEDREKIGNSLSYFIELVYGVWNLIIPTSIVHQFCVPETVTPLAAFALQYTSSIYPLILIFISFLLIKLYECNFRVIMWMSMPCRKFWLRFRRKIDSRATIIDIFASFLLLSYTKLTITSFILLAPTTVYDHYGHPVKTVLLYDGNVTYFSHEHIKYAAIAIFVLCFMVLPPPLLLLFYQFHWFQKILTKCRINGHLLALFMHSFQQGYKDGRTVGSRDLRFFSTIYFFFRILAFALYSFVGDYFTLYYSLHIMSLTYAFIFAVFRPFREDYFNKAESFIAIVMAFITSSAVNNSIHLIYMEPSLPIAIILYVITLFPLVYMSIYIAVWFIRKLYNRHKEKILRQLHDSSDVEDQMGEQDHLVNHDDQAAAAAGATNRMKHLIHNLLENHSLSSPVNERVPDRLNNPDNYSDNNMVLEWGYSDTDTGTTGTATGSTGTATGTTGTATGSTGTATGTTGTATGGTTGTATGSTNQYSTHSSLNSQQQHLTYGTAHPPLITRKTRPRPASFRSSFKLANLSERLLPHHPNTN